MKAYLYSVCCSNGIVELTFQTTVDQLAGHDLSSEEYELEIRPKGKSPFPDAEIRPMAKHETR